MAFYTYIMACKSNTAIYIGVASNLRARVEQHKTGSGGTHTSKYRIQKLVYFEEHQTLADALLRERRLKRWRRDWKNRLISQHNPGWADLAMETSFL
ncbi:MAG: GIY-YIG nuclease family protein [Rhodobacteraceae bacterium]|nr:GIY-YIG nuclease family protein [Paracoccaceae bacterium]